MVKDERLRPPVACIPSFSHKPQITLQTGNPRKFLARYVARQVNTMPEQVNTMAEQGGKQRKKL
jgi:hypothetical protein